MSPSAITVTCPTAPRMLETTGAVAVMSGCEEFSAAEIRTLTGQQGLWSQRGSGAKHDSNSMPYFESIK